MGTKKNEFATETFTSPSTFTDALNNPPKGYKVYYSGSNSAGGYFIVFKVKLLRPVRRKR